MYRSILFLLIVILMNVPVWAQDAGQPPIEPQATCTVTVSDIGRLRWFPNFIEKGLSGENYSYDFELEPGEELLALAASQGSNDPAAPYPDGLWWLVYSERGWVGWIEGRNLILDEDCANLIKLFVNQEIYTP